MYYKSVPQPFHMRYHQILKYTVTLNEFYLIPSKRFRALIKTLYEIFYLLILFIYLFNKNAHFESTENGEILFRFSFELL